MQLLAHSMFQCFAGTDRSGVGSRQCQQCHDTTMLGGLLPGSSIDRAIGSGLAIPVHVCPTTIARGRGGNQTQPMLNNPIVLAHDILYLS